MTATIVSEAPATGLLPVVVPVSEPVWTADVVRHEAVNARLDVVRRANVYANSVGAERVRKAVSDLVGESVSRRRVSIEVVPGGSEWQQDVFVYMRITSTLWVRTKAVYRVDGSSYVLTPWLMATCPNCEAVIEQDGTTPEAMRKAQFKLRICSCGAGWEVAA